MGSAKVFVKKSLLSYRLTLATYTAPPACLASLNASQALTVLTVSDRKLKT